ncbi:hypothetical protein [Streptomyces ardesiacus]|uniref:hypothetical protein n=1 Tax=Streptomyces ardesiacus TaxID=285564 RepID=UPI0036EF0A4B
MTHTRTHVYVTFANPYLRCDLCHAWVTRWHNNDKCGCNQECWLEPCNHSAGSTSACPSWDPIDGCQCQEVLGRVEHGQPSITGAQQAELSAR